jgi:hypothetical protein
MPVVVRRQLRTKNHEYSCYSLSKGQTTLCLGEELKVSRWSVARIANNVFETRFGFYTIRWLLIYVVCRISVFYAHISSKHLMMSCKLANAIAGRLWSMFTLSLPLRYSKSFP